MRKYSLFILVALFAFSGACGQRFFQTIPKPSGEQGIALADAVPTVQDLLRPVVEVSAYGFPGNILLTGGGFSYQHLKFKKDRWRVQWSISYITWFNLKKVFTGLTIGILNNLILVGVAAHSKEIIGTLGIGFNFNN